MPVFDHIQSSISALIPNPLSIEPLQDKGIVLGKKITQNSKMKILLAENYLKEKGSAADKKPA